MGKNIAVILSAGVGARSGLSIPKQFFKVAGKTILEHSITVFEKHPQIHDIIVVTHKDYTEKTRDIVTYAKFEKVSSVVFGGKTRQESSYNALKEILDDEANVLFHDSVRPFLTQDIITECITALESYSSVDVAIPSSDTLIKVNENRTIDSIPSRKNFMRGQTPQCFRVGLIKKLHEQAKKEGRDDFTDDCSLVSAYSDLPTYVVIGSEFNRKITTPVDVAICDKLFQLQTLSSLILKKDLLKKKVIVVFGGSKGIGENIVRMAKSYGAVVYSFSRSEDLDILDYKKVSISLKEVFQKEGRIDDIIVTAGILKKAPINERSIEDITSEININYLAIVNIAKESYPYLKSSHGSLTLFSSSSYTRGRENYSTYSSIKAGIVNLTQALSEEWYDSGIRVNVMSPERANTPMRLENFGKEDPKTLLSPEIIAEQTLAVTTSNITGQVIDVRIPIKEKNS